MAIETPNNSNDKVVTKITATEITPDTKEKKETIKNETGKNLSNEMQKLAQSLTPEKFKTELESLKNKDLKGKDSLLSSMLSQLSYKGIAIEQITGEKSIKLFSSDGTHSGYERALNEALENQLITMSDLQTALMYQTTSLDEFVKTNSGDKKEGLKTTKYVEFMINKYALNEKGLKDKNGNINVGVINNNVSNLGDREFLLSFFTARNNNINVKFDDDIPQRYNQEIQDKVKLINDNIPKESLEKLGIYADKTDKLTADFTKDPMGTMMNAVLENGGTGLMFGILALFFGKGFKGFATGFLGGTALQTLGLDGVKKVGGKLADLTGDGVDAFKKLGIDEKYKATYNKMLAKVKTADDKDFTESDFVTKFKDFSKSEDFKKCNISDLENNYKSETLDKFFTSKMEIDGKTGSDYFIGETKDKDTLGKNVKQNRTFLKYLLGEKEAIDNGKTIEELFKTKDEATSATSPEVVKDLKITQHEIIKKAQIQDGIGLTTLNQLKTTSIVNLETAYNGGKIDSLFKIIFKDTKNLFYTKNKTEIDKLVKTIIDTVPSDKKTQKVFEAITVV